MKKTIVLLILALVTILAAFQNIPMIMVYGSLGCGVCYAAFPKSNIDENGWELLFMIAVGGFLLVTDLPMIGGRFSPESLIRIACTGIIVLAGWFGGRKQCPC